MSSLDVDLKGFSDEMSRLEDTGFDSLTPSEGNGSGKTLSLWLQS